MSPLTQGLNYRSACDDDGSAHRSNIMMMIIIITMLLMQRQYVRRLQSAYQLFGIREVVMLPVRAEGKHPNAEKQPRLGRKLISK